MSDGYWKNTARSWLGQGLAMGWGDELEARIRAIGPETYEEELNKINSEYDEYRSNSPGAALTGELVGGFLPTVASIIATPFTGGAATPVATANAARTGGALVNAGKAIYRNTIGRNALTTGATTGTVTGALSGAGMANPGERNLDAIVGGGLGGLIGLALPIGGRGAIAVKDFIKDRLASSGKAIEEVALQKVYDAVAMQGGTPQDLLRMIEADELLGVPTTPANLNMGTLNLTENLNTAGRGDVPAIIDDQLKKTQMDSRKRVESQTKKALSNRNFFDQQDVMLNQLRSGANEAYESAYAFGAVNDPRIINLLENNSTFKAAFERAKRIAENEKAADLLAGGDGSAFELIPYKITKGKGGKPVADVLPDVRTLDYLKRGLDDIIRKGFDGTGAAPAEAAALKKLRNQFVNVLDEATEVDGVSAYAQARKLYAGDMEVLDALALGRSDFGKMAPEEVAKAFENMSGAESEAFLDGATRNLLDRMNKPSTNRNFARELIGSPDMRKKIQMLFPAAGPEGLALFEAALLRESQLFVETGRVLGGSPSARRIAGAGILAENSTVGDAVGAAIETGSPTNALVRMVSNLIRTSSLPAKSQERMARMLMSDNPEEVATVVQALEDFAARSIPKAKALNRRETANVFGAAQLPPNMSSEEGTSTTIEEISTETLEIDTPERDTEITITDEMKEQYPNLFGD